MVFLLYRHLERADSSGGHYEKGEAGGSGFLMGTSINVSFSELEKHLRRRTKN